MRILYVTLNNNEEARSIAHTLLEQKLAVCCNWFSITCAYRWEGKIIDEPEIVLLIKTQPGYRDAIENVIRGAISYKNCIAELAPESVNVGFRTWLDAEVPSYPGQ